MELYEAIAGRRSVREYTSEPVDEETILRLVQAATQAPSAMNEQPWTFTVVRDQGLLDRLSTHSKRHLLAITPPGTQSEQLHAMLDDPDFQIFYHAPMLVLISAIGQGPWIAEDCALAAENLMLAAHGSGLGTCWIGLAQEYLRTPGGKELLGLSAGSVPMAAIIVGHPKRTVSPVPRKPPKIRWIDA